MQLPQSILPVVLAVGALFGGALAGKSTRLRAHARFCPSPYPDAN